MDIVLVRSTDPYLAALRSPWEEPVRPVRPVATADAVVEKFHQSIELEAS